MLISALRLLTINGEKIMPTMLINLISNKFALYALGVALSALCLWGFGKYQHAQGYSKAQNDRAYADLAAFKSEAERLQGLSVTLETQLTELRQAKPQIIERYNRVVVEKPLPAGCFIDPDRLREINAASQAANSRKPGQPMPKGQ